MTDTPFGSIPPAGTPESLSDQPSIGQMARPATFAKLLPAYDDPAEWGTVAVGTRLAQMVDPGFFHAWSTMLSGGLRPGDALLVPPLGMAAHHAANTLVVEFLASGCDSLLMMDHDHTFFPDTLERLRTDQRGADYGTVCALYASRHGHKHLVLKWAPQSTDDDPLMMPVLGWERGDLVPVDVTPLGFTLIRREVLTAIGGDEGPWFRYVSDLATEDIWFSQMVARVGYRMGVNTAVPIGHVIRGTIVPYDDVPL